MSKNRNRGKGGNNPFAGRRQQPKKSQKNNSIVSAEMRAAVEAQNNGDLATARKIYEQILSNDPNSGYALIYLGTIFYHNGDLINALDYIERGHRAGVNDETYYINKGLVLAKQENHVNAIEHYRRALEIMPNSVEALFNMGNSLYRLRNFADASEAFTKALAIQPDNWLVEYQLACSLQDNQRHHKALEHFTNIHNKTPNDPRVLCGIGMSLAGTYKHREGLQYLLKAIEQAPNNFIFHFNIANVYKSLGQHSDSRKHYEKALEINPRALEALLGMGRMLVETGKFTESREYFQRAIDIDSTYHSSYSSMGTSYMKNDVNSAIEWFDKALKLKPDADDVLMLKGYSLSLLGKLEDAENCLRKAIELNPDFAEHYQNLANVLVIQGRVAECLELCKKSLLINKSNNKAFSNILLYMHYVPQSSPEDLLMMHQKYNSLFSPIYSPPSLPPFAITPDPQKKLRIGFVSADLRRHSVAYFLEPLLRNHDRQQVEIICYASVKTPDLFTKALHSHCEGWRDILPLSDFEAAEVIRHDKVDILIDLGGHTADNRLPIFFRRPAPLQVSWLGYPDTTGLDCIDYRIVDEITDPSELEKFSTEKVFRLPGGFHCYGTFPDSPEVVTPPCIENGYVTFGSFNNYAKASAETHYLWAEILRNVPNSRLLLKSLGLNDEIMHKTVHERFEKLGVDPSRIEVLGKTAKIADHLLTYNRVDIGLDTYPYNGTTTTFEAMWMGVPVISLSAHTHASLVGKSILTYTGLEDLACDTPEKYVGTAKALAANPELLTQVRMSMRERMQSSPFLDEQGFCRKFFGALRYMWQECCENNSNNPEFFAPPVAHQNLFAPNDGGLSLNFGQPATQSQQPSLCAAADSGGLSLNFGAPVQNPSGNSETAANGLKLNFGATGNVSNNPTQPTNGDDGKFTLKF